MAQDRPAKLPEWASNPAPAPPTAITEPLQAEKEQGWLPGQPFREYVNWFWNLVWQWVVWLNASTFRFDIFGPDQAIPGDGSLPPVGGGSLTRGAGDFSARVIADGYLGVLVDSPDVTYLANHATFWDLRRDGAWVKVQQPLPVFVNPPLTPDAARVYRVDTNATEPTAVFDLRPEKLIVSKPIDFGRGQRFGALDPSYETAARITEYGISGILNQYSLIEEFNNDAQGNVRLYVRNDGVLVVVRGASWAALGQQWTIDAGHVGDVQYVPLDAEGFNAKHLSQLVGSPFPDSLWFADADLAGNLDRELATEGSVRGGGAFANSSVVGAQSNLPTFVGLGSNLKDERDYTFNGGLRLANVYTLLANTNQGTDGASRGREVTSNCFFDAPSGLWLQTLVGADAFKWEISTAGARLLWHPAANGNSWQDTIGGLNWQVLWSVREPQVIRIPATRAIWRVPGGVSAWTALAFQSLATVGSEPGAIQKEIDSNAGGVIWFERGDLPEGAIIDSAQLEVTPNENAGEMRFAVVRFDLQAPGAQLSFVDGAVAFDTVSGGARVTAPCTFTVNEAIRTVDRSRYGYGLWFSSTNNSRSILHGVRVTYRVT